MVEQKARLGDWECDTVIARASLYTRCSRVFSQTAQVVSQAIIRLLHPFKERVKTLTGDKGEE